MELAKLASSASSGQQKAVKTGRRFVAVKDAQGKVMLVPLAAGGAGAASPAPPPQEGQQDSEPSLKIVCVRSNVDDASSSSVAPVMCQACGLKPPEFLCSSCRDRWYCSRDCQEADWDEHADNCSVED